MSTFKREEILLLFDVDGTLTPARKVIEPEFEEFLYTKVKPKATLGVVGGSDYPKIIEQLNGKRLLKEFDYVFPENGLIHIEKGVEISRQSIQTHLGEDVLKRFINFCLRYIADLDIPIKRGTFIDFRAGMINICPIGRQCTYDERLEFHEYDTKNFVRQKFVEALKKEFANVDLTFSIGGQISIDAFPRGWDKTYCLNHVTKGTDFKEIHFFGDKTDKGGNDHEIFEDSRTIGHKVLNPKDTQRQLQDLFDL
ncbi:CLUMA_CG011780, isoform A [Clunio marinus]|uniref:Phosphomannomutase n=1 Tax=Clunio marinus TaxID=568069 RepID=A0A1J1IHA7_9DIPT|nr:CLUMA_CG011780, isoform A [Clunio marinus]